jgi:hypothetical protein
MTLLERLRLGTRRRAEAGESNWFQSSSRLMCSAALTPTASSGCDDHASISA